MQVASIKFSSIFGNWFIDKSMFLSSENIILKIVNGYIAVTFSCWRDFWLHYTVGDVGSFDLHNWLIHVVLTGNLGKEMKLLKGFLLIARSR